ncbi:MAG: chromosomal replication initiator protein DnaA [Deltaproteobacteria bacterium]|jgi:chromosomal replication initiator protein|nr:chromosomal replication initiator protein DnaA [Deltaproteobacteria bacterium]
MNADWPAIAKNLQKTLEPGIFKVWIAPLDGEIRDASVCLHAPNDFVANWVRDRLAAVICEAAAAVLGLTPDAVSLVVRSANTAPVPRIVSPVETAARPQPEQGMLISPEYPEPKWRFSFEDFVVGPSNEMAYAAAKGLCADLADAGTLFVSAGSGLGKTHLVQAVGKCLSEGKMGTRHKISYLTAEEFASCFVIALKARDVEGFKARLRQSDVLLLEDVHFLQNKGKMQEEALSLIKSLQSKGSRLVLTSSFAPRELHHMDCQLVSLCCAGLLAHMASPTLETRRCILREKARAHQALLPEPVSELLATRITSNVRQLESCLNNLIFMARLLNRQICLEMALEMIGQYAEAHNGLDMAAIIRLVCDSFKLSEAQLASRSRRSEYVQARNTVYYLARKHTQLSLQDIGDLFHRRHSSVIKGISSLEREMQRESTLGRQLAHTVALVERNAGV